MGVVKREEFCEDHVPISRMQASSSTAQSSHPSPFILFSNAERGKRARATTLSGVASIAEKAELSGPWRKMTSDETSPFQR